MVSNSPDAVGAFKHNVGEVALSKVENSENLSTLDTDISRTEKESRLAGLSSDYLPALVVAGTEVFFGVVSYWDGSHLPRAPTRLLGMLISLPNATRGEAISGRIEGVFLLNSLGLCGLRGHDML